MWKPELNVSGRWGKSKALVEAITEAIETGELKPGERLPAQRDLAHSLDISFQTVSNAYREVQKTGLIRSEVGRGSFVSAHAKSESGSFILTPGAGDQIDLSVTYLAHHPLLDRFFRATALSLADQLQGPWMYESRPVAGAKRHREVASDWLRGMNVGAGAEQLFVVNGATHGIFLALSAVAKPGDTVLTETLTENGTIGAAHILGLNLKGVQTDEQGIIPEALDEAYKRYRDVVALVWVPSLGNPKAHMAGRKRREEIARVAEFHDIAVIEDEVYRPLVDRGLPAVTDLLPGKGFFATGFSKSVMTGMRVGYLVAPSPYTYRIASAMRSTTWSCAPLMSEFATRWIEDGSVEKIVDIRRKEAVVRQELVGEYLKPHISGAHPCAPYAWLKIPEGWDEAAIAAELQEAKILISTSAPFAVGTDEEQGIRISISGLSDLDILRRALKTIRETFDKLPIG